jgi:hypothetical protein
MPRRCHGLKPLSRAARLPTASRRAQPPRSRRPPPDRRPRSHRRRLDHLADRAIAQTAVVPPRPPRSPLAVRRAAISVPMSRCSPPSPMRRRRAAVGSPSSAVTEPRHRRAAPCGRGTRPRCATGPSVISAQWHPVKFYYFLIYPIHYKFKNLCRIHLNLENYETNFVRKV